MLCTCWSLLYNKLCPPSLVSALPSSIENSQNSQAVRIVYIPVFILPACFKLQPSVGSTGLIPLIPNVSMLAEFNSFLLGVSKDYLSAILICERMRRTKAPVTPRGCTGAFPSVERMTHSLASAFGLASFTTECTQLGWLASKSPSFVSTFTKGHDRIISLQLYYGSRP